MKKKALALGLTLVLLAQSVWVPASFADTQTAETALGEDSAATPQSESYSHSISEAGLELIKSFEGYHAYPYWDVNHYTYGYGSATEVEYEVDKNGNPLLDEEGEPIPKLDENGNFISVNYPGGIPEREAAELLRQTVDIFNEKLNQFLETNKVSLNQNQFDALSSFTYNLGRYIWGKDSTINLRNLLISGDYTEAELREVYEDFCHAGGKVLVGLQRRRAREMDIFFSEYDLCDPNADLYVVNTTSSRLYIRSEPSAKASSVGSVASTKVIRVHKYSEDGKWAYTSYCGYFGWVSMDYLVSIDEDDHVTKLDEHAKDEQGISYTLDDLTMTAAVGSADQTSNTSGYEGAYAGEVYLTKYILSNGQIYKLTALSDSAFTDCNAIDSIYIPPTVEQIGENTFKDSTLDTVYYTAGGYASDWAKQNGYSATDYRCRTGHDYGEWKVVQKATDTQIQIEESVCSVCQDAQTRSYERLELASLPRKTEYKEGEAFSTSGLLLEAVYTDGTHAKITDYTVSGADTSEIGSKTVTVSHGTLSVTFNISVSQKQLTGITISKKPSKLTYIEGSAIVLDGLAVKANYDNGTSVSITEYSVSGYDPNKVGKQTITVTYNGFKATFNVTVKAKTLTAIAFSSRPENLEYFCGEAFDPTGMVLKLTYDNGTVEYIDSGYKISGYNTNKAGTQTVKVTYGGKSLSLKVTVILNELRSDAYTPENGKVIVPTTGMTVAELTAAFESSDRVQVIKDGHSLASDVLVGTGMTLRLIYNGQVQDSVTIVVIGDVTGDGCCSMSDFVALGDHFVDRTTLTDVFLAAADLDRSGRVDLSDYAAFYDNASHSSDR